MAPKTTTSRTLLRVFLVLTILLFASQSKSEEDVNEDPLSVSPSVSPSSLPAGANGTLTMDLSLPHGFKAYVDMFKVTWKSPSGVIGGSPKVEPAFKFEDKFTHKVREGIKDKATLTSRFEIPATVAPGDYKAEVDLTYQACTENYCLFPSTKTYTLNLKVLPANAETLSPSGTTHEAETSSFEGALKKGKIYTFIFVFLAGLLTSLTPCIFPMIPITLAVIGARSSDRGRLKNFSVSLAYVMGIAMTYSLLGILAAKTGAMFGSALGHPAVVTGIAVIFVIMALSMYGAFEFRMPAFLTQSLGSTKTGSGYVGAFFTGLITGLVASPCVGPVLVSILTYVAETQDMVFGFFLLFTFAVGMGQLFLVLGTFSGLIQKLPKSGHWMDVVKFVFGSTMVGAALYYLAPVTPQRIFDSLIALALVLISGAYGAFGSTEHLTTYKKKMVKALMYATFWVGVAFAIKSAFGSFFTPGVAVAPTEGGSPAVKLNWKPYSEDAMEQALKSGKPILIDFWADWCVACKELELLTFTYPQAREESEKFNLFKIEATHDTEEVRRLKKKFRVVGLPTLILYDSNGHLRNDLVLTGFEPGPKFAERLKKAQEPKKN